jgi:hypothetical protein
MTFILAVLLHYACCAFFVCAGLYALTHGFIKTGGWLISGAVISILSTTIKTGKSGKKDMKEAIELLERAKADLVLLRYKGAWVTPCKIIRAAYNFIDEAIGRLQLLGNGKGDKDE